ncbi:hypothetical protein [Emcibacter sp. SYSU 3D8]|uniref:hypothetical protein n=1 Tax=Emcibacter sp. SYSU 3D8 TaxID=3133969 RepID=UPI0031FE8305
MNQARGIFGDNRAIFIHISKTAGVSLKHSLGVLEETGHADDQAFQMASPARINWADVTTLHYYRDRLRELTDKAFHEGGHAA